MRFEAFRTHQFEAHVPLATALPGLMAYRLFLFPPSGDQAQPFHGMAQVTFESAEAHDAAMASPQGQKALADLKNFLDMNAITVLTATEGHFITGSK